MIYEVALPAHIDPHRHHAGVIEAWLRKRGVDVAWTTITDDRIIVDADIDPSRILQDFSPEPDEKAQARQALAALDLERADAATFRLALKHIRQLLIADLEEQSPPPLEKDEEVGRNG